MAGIQQHQACQLARCGGGDDLAPEAPFHEEREAAAVVEVRMGEEEEIDAGGVEAERLRVFFDKLALPLEEAAVDENTLPSAFDQVAGTGDIMVGTVE
jgi:hypothetical protein